MTGRTTGLVEPPTLARRVLAEFLGTGLLVAIVVGSGIMATDLARDTGLQLLANSVATAAGLAVLIVMLGPVSGAHFNPVVTVTAWLLGRRDGTGLPARAVAAYLPAQITGGIGGAILANLMFGLSAVHTSGHNRSAGHLLLGEVVATAGLIVLVTALTRQGRTRLAPGAVGAYIGAAYWFTSSTSFANPAVTIARAFTDTFAGIAPGSVSAFIAAQFTGALIGAALATALYPATRPALNPAHAEPLDQPATA